MSCVSWMFGSSPRLSLCLSLEILPGWDRRLPGVSILKRVSCRCEGVVDYRQDTLVEASSR